MVGGYSSRLGRLRFDRGIGAVLLLIPVVLAAMITYWFWPSDPGDNVSAFGTDTTQDTSDTVQSGTPSTIANGSSSAIVDVTTPADQTSVSSEVTTTTDGSATKAPDATAPTSSTETAATTPDETSSSETTNTSESTSTSSDTKPPEPTTAATTAPTTEQTTTTALEQATSEAPTTSPPTGNCSSNARFERVFRDDFNGDNLGGQWNTYHSPGNAGFGLRRASAISVGNGHLVMTAQMVDGNLESGGMSHELAQTYGMYKVRVRTDDDPSQSTSGVVITWPASNVHPRDGENNIYETGKTRLRNPFYSYIHEPFGTIHDQKQFVHNADGAQFQVMTMEWTPNRITITREGPGGGQGREVHVLDENGDDLIPDVPHRMTVQLDAWADSMTGVVRMEVDWLEIYKYCGG